MLAYAAGFLDGEGCIRINFRKARQGRSDQFALLVMIAQKDGRPIDWLAGNFGGVVYLKNKKMDGTNWIYEWKQTDRGAYLFLKEVFPFLLYKKEQAALAIRFQERLKYERARNQPDNGRFAGLSTHEQEVRLQMYKEMSALKHQFQKSKRPNVKQYSFKSMLQA